MPKTPNPDEVPPIDAAQKLHTVRDLLILFQNIRDAGVNLANLKIILATDSEGNGFNVIESFSLGTFDPREDPAFEIENRINDPLPLDPDVVAGITALCLWPSD